MSIRNMFKRFFKKDSPERISRMDYWKRWELLELFDDLHLAEQLLKENQLEPGAGFEEFKYQFIENLYI